MSSSSKPFALDINNINDNTIIPTGNVLFTVTNTDPEYADTSLEEVKRSKASLSSVMSASSESFADDCSTPTSPRPKPEDN